MPIIYLKMVCNFKSLLELNDFFKEEKTCYEFLAHQIWEAGKPVCPFCGSTEIYTTKGRSTKPEKRDIPEYRCKNKECAKKFSTTTGTIFEASKISLRTWYAAIYLITTHKKGISSLQLATDLDITQKTAWFVLHRIREMYKESAPDMLRDVVSVDHSLVGGKNKNRHSDKKKQNTQGGLTGDKTIVLGARGLTGKVLTKVVPSIEADTTLPIIEKWVEPGSIMVTDEAKSFRGLSAQYFHITVDHSAGQYATGAFSSNGIENFWSLFKRGIIGIYHQISPKHLERYSTEFAYRYNSKDDSARTRFTNTVQNANGIRLRWNDLTKGQQ